MATRVDYMYLDGANNKLHLSAVLQGELTEEEIKEIFDLSEDVVFHDCNYFYPGNTGLPATTFVDKGYAAYDNDPEWHELVEISHTEAAPTEDVTAAEFLEAFRNKTALLPPFLRG